MIEYASQGINVRTEAGGEAGEDASSSYSINPHCASLLEPES